MIVFVILVVDHHRRSGVTGSGTGAVTAAVGVVFEVVVVTVVLADEEAVFVGVGVGGDFDYLTTSPSVRW